MLTETPPVTANSKDRFELTDHFLNRSVRLPAVVQTVGETVGVDARNLRTSWEDPKFGGAKGGPGMSVEVYNPNGDSHQSTKSKVTFIDGDKGILRYRGRPIEELAANSNYMEVAYLLTKGDLPKTRAELSAFEQDIIQNSSVPDSVKDMIANAEPDVTTMDLMAAAVALLPSKTKDQHFIGKAAVIGAMISRKELQKNDISVQFDPAASFTENYLTAAIGKKPTAAEIKAMDLNLILHADHEQNAGTTTARDSASTKTSTKLALVAGITALAGPLHGGANEDALNNLKGILHGDHPVFLEKGLDTSSMSIQERVDTLVKHAEITSGYLIPGFGHRVYKNFDPRSTILGAAGKVVLEELGDKISPEFKELLEVGRLLEDGILASPILHNKKLYSNVDKNSGTVQQALGFPETMMTPNFAVARMTGWLAHIAEQRLDKEQKINRPRQGYVGEVLVPYVSMNDRDPIGAAPAAALSSQA